MAGMPWVKLYVDFLDDHKIGMLDPSVQLFFVKLLLLVGDCDAEGYLVNGVTPIESQHIAWRLRMPKSDVDSALACLVAAELIEYDDGIIVLPAFQKRQGRSQSDKRELWRQRKAKQRGQERDEAECHAGVTRDAPVSPTPRGEESRVEKRREEREETPPTRPPASTHHPAVSLYQEIVGSLPPKTWRNLIVDAVGVNQVNLDRWGAVCHGWVGTYKTKNSPKGMLDFFGRNEVPGERHPTGPPGNNGQSSTDITLQVIQELKEEAARANNIS